MAESNVSVRRDGGDFEITSVVKVTQDDVNGLIDYVKEYRTDYWLENLDTVPPDWQVRDMVNRLGLRDEEVKRNLIDAINNAYRDATRDGSLSSDDDDWWERMNERMMAEFDNLTDDEKGDAVSSYIQRNIGELEYTLESPCCCYGIDEVDEKLNNIIMKRLFPDRNIPTIVDLQTALLEYVDETPPKQVELSKLTSIVTAIFAGGAVMAGSDIGSEPTGWSPK